MWDDETLPNFIKEKAPHLEGERGGTMGYNLCMYVGAPGQNM
jgi:hypothetical protein